MGPVEARGHGNPQIGPLDRIALNALLRRRVCVLTTVIPDDLKRAPTRNSSGEIFAIPSDLDVRWIRPVWHSFQRTVCLLDV